MHRFINLLSSPAQIENLPAQALCQEPSPIFQANSENWFENASLDLAQHAWSMKQGPGTASTSFQLRSFDSTSDFLSQHCMRVALEVPAANSAGISAALYIVAHREAANWLNTPARLLGCSWKSEGKLYTIAVAVHMCICVAS